MSEKHGSAKAYGRWHHDFLESKGAIFAIFTTVAISIGGLVEIVPMFTASFGPERQEWVTPYTPLEVAGRDIYTREGCYLCHSQWVRPFRAEVLRYGEWSRAAEYTYDRPFLLGSRRLGPDLHRVGGKYPDAWHYEHMRDPRSTTPGSVMPPYPWLYEAKIDVADVQASLRALRTAGTPYTDSQISQAGGALQGQGGQIVQSLAGAGVQVDWDDEIVALIAYLQRLGVEGREHLAGGADGGGLTSQVGQVGGDQ